MQERLFRKVALERVSSPERLDELMQVVPFKAWLAAIALAGLLLAGVVWSYTGNLQITAGGSGILIRGGRLYAIASPIAGQILRMPVEAGEVLEAGGEIAQIAPGQGDDTTILYAPFDSRVLEVRIGEGTFVQPGTVLVTLEKSDEPLEAIVYVSPADGKLIGPGMQVRLLLSTVQPEEYGYLLGTVESVGQYPATREGMMLILGSEDLLDLLAIQGGSIELHVRLETNDLNPSEYSWSSGSGPEMAIQSGILVDARIILREMRPIDLFLVEH